VNINRGEFADTFFSNILGAKTQIDISKEAINIRWILWS